MLALEPFKDFVSASTDILTCLQDRLGFQSWVIARKESEDWIVYDAVDGGFDIHRGQVFRWSDTICSRMVEGLGPRIAPRVMDYSAYAAAPATRCLSVGAYVGVPLTRRGGKLLGTLCAFDSHPKSDAIVEQLPWVELMSRLLATLLENEQNLQTAQTALREGTKGTVSGDKAVGDELIDFRTGVYNRSTWDSLLQQEEHRCQRYGHPVCVVSIGLDDLKIVNLTDGNLHGDKLLQRAGKVLRDATRASDVVARLEAGEFSIMAIECDPAFADLLKFRLESAMQEARISVSIGIAMRGDEDTLGGAFSSAKRRMREAHDRRKGHLGFSQN